MVNFLSLRLATVFRRPAYCTKSYKSRKHPNNKHKTESLLRCIRHYMHMPLISCKQDFLKSFYKKFVRKNTLFLYYVQTAHCIFCEKWKFNIIKALNWSAGQNRQVCRHNDVGFIRRGTKRTIKNMVNDIRKMPDSDICLPLRKNAWANGSNSKARRRKYVRPILKYV